MSVTTYVSIYIKVIPFVSQGLYWRLSQETSMITNINSLFPVMVQKLENSGFEFFPTGSRYFGGYKPDSDWDFMAQASSEVEEFLTSNGFEAISAEE